MKFKIRYEKCWPAIRQDLNGVIIVVDSKNNKYDNTLDDWVNNFCQDFNIENIMCFSYSKEEDKNDAKQKISNQFPKISIYEVSNDYNNLLPHLNKFITKIISNLLP